MTKKIKDSDILKAMTMFLDEDSAVYGANGHYSIGAFYDKNSLYEDASQTDAAKAWYSDCGKMVDYLKGAVWLKG